MGRTVQGAGFRVESLCRTCVPVLVTSLEHGDVEAPEGEREVDVVEHQPVCISGLDRSVHFDPLCNIHVGITGFHVGIWPANHKVDYDPFI